MKRKSVHVKLAFILCLAFLAVGCVLISPSMSVPHANFKIAVDSSGTKMETLEKIDQVLTTMSFTLQENDWEVWEPILESERLAEKKEERRYRKGVFEIFYGVMYQTEPTGFIRLSYYEHESRQFTDQGIELYHSLYQAFSNHGLMHLDETPEDVKLSRPVVTPEMFNDANPLPPITNTIKYAAMALLTFSMYVLIVLFPSWLLIRKLSTKRVNTVSVKRSLIAFIPALSLFPVPIPMSMFGPMLMIPGVLFIPFVFELPSNYLPFVASSMLGTLAVSALASLWLIKKTPNKALQPTPKSGAAEL